MRYFFTLLLIFSSSCSSSKQIVSKKADGPAIDLVESTSIIRELMRKNQLYKILEDHSQDELDILINNFSPATIAFEVEVLSTTTPLGVVCYASNSDQTQKKFISQFNEAALQYTTQAKFIMIDADRLYSLAQDAEIENFPTIILVKNREIVDRIEGYEAFTYLHEKIKQHCSKQNFINQ